MARIVNDNMTVEVGAHNAGAFGDLISVEPTPILQMDFVSGLNTQVVTYSVSGTGAAVDTNSSRLRVQSGTSNTGSAVIQSRRPIRYRAGEGVMVRFTAAFTTGVASSTQIVGVGNTTDGYFIGFNGTSFGVLHRNNGGNTWTAQTAWNGDRCDGTGPTGFNINKTYGNVYQIKYPFLGYGNITFWVLDSSTSKWLLVHTIKYANTTATVQLSNPNLSFYAQSVNSGNTSNLTMYCGSFAAFITGKRLFTSNPKWAMDNNKSSITTETNLLTLKNCTTYNGSTNRALIRLNSISAAASAASGVTVIRLKLNASLGGSPSYNTINGTTADSGVTITNGNSIASYDTAGTTVTGGTYIYNLSIDNPAGAVVGIEDYDLYIGPGETLTVSAQSTISSAVSVSLNWTEDI